MIRRVLAHHAEQTRQAAVRARAPGARAGSRTPATVRAKASPGEVAVDGKTLRGAKDSEGNQVDLLAVMTPALARTHPCVD